MGDINLVSQNRHVRRIAILNKKSLASHTYDKWISDADSDVEVMLFTEENTESRAFLPLIQNKYAHTALYDSWKIGRLPDIDIAEIHKEHPFDRVVALSECDVVRASELRDSLGITGMNTVVARAFRDKVLMKQLAANAGLAVPAFASVTTASDLLDFAEANPGPIVIKPTDGAGSVGVSVFQDKSELLSWIRTQRQVKDEPMRYMIETYVDAPMVSVDGIMTSGKIITAMTSSYQGTCLDALMSQQPVAVLQLDSTSGTGKRALDYASRLIAAFPTPVEPTSFHLELFDVQSGPLLCEIAARTGGGKIDDLATHVLGLNLEQWSCLGQAGLSPQIVAPACSRSSDFFGAILLPKRGGVLTSAPTECPLDGVIDYRLHYNVGERIMPNKKSSDAVADLVFKSSDVSSLHALYENILEWHAKEFQWSL
ncbi:acetyl-CoA carboxylase biotin carboxylase subunit family protein [Lysinibacillus sp. NPDC097231]|uniref:ATP-grasp domain-containing protein n=1 Tax=Lysinibacillus sp. NPDC097231 TaxID=3364142 RepID=UPI0038138B20